MMPGRRLPWLIAQQIYAEAHSGSARWDELNGPSAVLTEDGEDRFALVFPQERNEDGALTGRGVRVTVEWTDVVGVTTS